MVQNMNTTTNIHQAECPYCDKTTNCIVIAQEVASNYTDHDLACDIFYNMLKCQGCGNVFFLRAVRDYTDFDYDENGNMLAKIHADYFPISESKKYKIHCPNNDTVKALTDNDLESSYIKPLYLQISRALNEGYNILAAIGMRSLINAVSIDKADGTIENSFSANLDLLTEKGCIAPKQNNILKKIINIGNKATHRNNIPSEDLLATCMNVIDHILEGIYVQPKRYSQMKDDN